MQTIDPAEFLPPRRIAQIDAFAACIEAYVVPDQELLNADLLAAIARMQVQSPGLTASNHDGWHSARDFFLQREPCFQVLQAHFMAALTQSIRRYWAQFDPAEHLATCEGWVNVNGRGGFNLPHDHPGNHLSACYYVAVPRVGDKPRESAIEFMNPAGALTQLMAFGAKMVNPTVRIDPLPGQLIVFPSYLKHWVYPNAADSERVSIAVNVTVREDSLEPATAGA